ncbi:MAG: hypothetical protein U0O22_04685 [Acutalibacteraceae bacterium]
MNVITDVTTLVAVLGVLAFVVSVISQLVKDMGFVNDLPVALTSTIISVILTVLSYIGYCSYAVISVEWYMVVASAVAGFIVSYISLYGWKKVCDLYKKHKKN